MIHFTKEEITDAKNLLWDVCNEEIVGKLVNRQGPSKSQSEITDIENAMNILAEKGVMPLFAATSHMIMQTPHEEQINVRPALKDIEESLETVLKKRCDNLDKKYDKSISKSDQGIKKIDDVIKRPELLEQNRSE